MSTGNETGTAEQNGDTSSHIVQAARITAEYVPDDECIACHAELSRSFHHVGMSQSFARWMPDNRIEVTGPQSRYYHQPSDRYYEMIERGDALLMQRYQLDGAGERINQLEISADFIIGSGHHARSYAHRLDATGELLELPITWYEPAREWRMSPGYDTPFHPGVARRIDRNCMFCHNAYPDMPVGRDRAGMPMRFPRELPQGIGCQRCHGPGREHVRVALDPSATADAINNSIVNPVDLDPVRRDDVCLQCHFQPSTEFPSLQRRFNVGDFAYQPGMLLSDFIVHVDYGSSPEQAERFHINHHPYRMHQSACFIASDAALTCLTCHDPHRKVAVAERAQFYRDRCLSCHTVNDCMVEAMAIPEHLTPDDCVSCHMPARRTQDAIRVVMTDHFIRRQPPSDDDDFLGELRELRPLGAVTPVLAFPERFKDDPLAEVYLHMAAVEHSASAHGVAQLERDVANLQTPEIDPLVRIAIAQSQLGNDAAAIVALERAQAIEPDNPRIMATLAPLLGKRGRLSEAVAMLQQLIASGNASAADRANLTVALAATGTIDPTQLIEACRIDPYYAYGHEQLGLLSLQMGDLSRAVDALTRALEIDPQRPLYAPLGVARIELANDWLQAMRIWNHGVTQTPNDAAVHATLAAALLLHPESARRNPSRAFDLAQRAVELDRIMHQAIIVHALAMCENDLPEEGLRTLTSIDPRAAGGGPAALPAATVAALCDLARGDREKARAQLQAIEANIARAPSSGNDFWSDAMLQLLRQRLEEN
ncbi:MAG: tetratricopeptide repeat protein [Phycisphaerales bacterium]